MPFTPLSGVAGICVLILVVLGVWRSGRRRPLWIIVAVIGFVLALGAHSGATHAFS